MIKMEEIHALVFIVLGITIYIDILAVVFGKEI
jgi:hypothetical protein